jgi:hypothetical protein
MRWRFPDATDTQETRARAGIERRIDAWWSAFAKHAPRIDALFKQRERWDLPAWMHEHLHPIAPELMWEFAPGLRGGHRLVLTPEVARHLRPLVDVVLARAPALEGWEFYAHRLPENVAMTMGTVEARAGVDFRGFRASVRPTDDGGVDLTYFSPNVRTIGDERAKSAAFVATETLLGEHVLDLFVDVIEVADRPRVGDDIDLESLSATVSRHLETERRRLSPAPFYERDDLMWTLWELKPEDAPDYPHQVDLFVGTSGLKEMWTRAHSGRAFASSRFSAFGETFCFLKIDRAEGLDEELFANKSEIEDALDAALKRAGLGAHVGGGTGRRYSYVDLALRDVERAIPVVRDTLRRGKVPRRSWLLFFDATLRDEWVGIWPETPPPP